MTMKLGEIEPAVDHCLPHILVELLSLSMMGKKVDQSRPC